MTKPDEISQHIWDAAYEALHPVVKKNYDTSPFAMVQHLGIAKAILSAVEQEREACAIEADKHAIEPDPDLEDIYDEWGMGFRNSARSIAAHIRSRKDQVDG